jgi:hypothetical protein
VSARPSWLSERRANDALDALLTVEVGWYRRGDVRRAITACRGFERFNARDFLASLVEVPGLVPHYQIREGTEIHQRVLIDPDRIRHVLGVQPKPSLILAPLPDLPTEQPKGA